MCVALDARESTNDVDATFQPSVAVLDAAVRVAAKEGVSEAWLNDAVKGYLSDTGAFETFLELSHLRVSCAIPEYMLAMKCLALRTGHGFQDEADILYLIRNLGVRQYDDAEEILRRYYPIDQYPKRNLLALRELIAEVWSRGSSGRSR